MMPDPAPQNMLTPRLCVLSSSKSAPVSVLRMGS